MICGPSSWINDLSDLSRFWLDVPGWSSEGLRDLHSYDPGCHA